MYILHDVLFEKNYYYAKNTIIVLVPKCLIYGCNIFIYLFCFPRSVIKITFIRDKSIAPDQTMIRIFVYCVLGNISIKLCTALSKSTVYFVTPRALFYMFNILLLERF